MNRKRTRRKTKRKYTRKLSNKKKHIMNRKSTNTHGKSKSKKNRNKHKKGGVNLNPITYFNKKRKSLGPGVNTVDFTGNDDLKMKCVKCGEENQFNVYTMRPYGVFLYCSNDNCKSVNGFTSFKATGDIN